MERYEIQSRLGDGTYGEVLRGKLRKTNEIVAIKRLKRLFPTWEECLQLRELKSLKILRHDNIIQLKEVIRDQAQLYYVFEYMDSNLYRLIRQANALCSSRLSSSALSSVSPPLPSSPFTEAQIQSIMYQLFSALAYTHKHGFFHRDIKPENLLCNDKVIKLADYGQAREIRSCPPFTEYVSTRWYRSPEVLLHIFTYNSPIDLWACGCILGELYRGKTLFPGTSTLDQLCQIFQLLGTPTVETWPEGIQAAQFCNFKLPKCSGLSLKKSFPFASFHGLQLLNDLLQYDPNRRITALQALQSKFFENFNPSQLPLLVPSSGESSFDGMNISEGKEYSGNNNEKSGAFYSPKYSNNRGFNKEDKPLNEYKGDKTSMGTTHRISRSVADYKEERRRYMEKEEISEKSSSLLYPDEGKTRYYPNSLPTNMNRNDEWSGRTIEGKETHEKEEKPTNNGSVLTENEKLIQTLLNDM